MKMAGTIENPPSPFNDGDSSFNPPEGPLEKIIRGSGKGLENTNSQENSIEISKEEVALKLVKERINEIKVDLENPAEAVTEIIKDLEEENIEISEYLEKYIKFAVSEKTNFLRDLRRLKINKDNPSGKEIKKLKEMALGDAEWMGNAVEYLRENKDNPEEIEKFWQEFDETFLSFKEHQNNKDFANKYSIKQGPEVIKRGILAEVVAMNLLEELVSDFKGCKKVEIKHSTPEQDVYKKIDFFVKITFERELIIEVPVQVKSCNISTFANRGSNKKELKGKLEFVLDNIINTNETERNVMIGKSEYQIRARNRMKEFFRENKGGIFIILPYGNLNPELLNFQNKNKKTAEGCLNKNGTPSEALRNRFLYEAQTIKNVEMNI